VLSHDLQRTGPRWDLESNSPGQSRSRHSEEWRRCTATVTARRVSVGDPDKRRERSLVGAPRPASPAPARCDSWRRVNRQGYLHQMESHPGPMSSTAPAFAAWTTSGPSSARPSTDPGATSPPTLTQHLQWLRATSESADNFIIFGHLRLWDPVAPSTALRDRDLLPVLSRQILDTSKIAWRKLRRVQISLWCAVLGTAALGLAAASPALGF